MTVEISDEVNRLTIQTPSSPFIRRLLMVLTISCVIALAGYAALGAYTRWMADDYCSASTVHTYGILGATQHQLSTWEGRFTHVFLFRSVAMALGPGFPALYPALAIIGFWSATLWLMWEVLKLMRVERPRLMALALASCFSFALVRGVPSIIQSLYWLGGSSPYLVALIVLVLTLAWMLRHVRLGSGKSARGTLIAVAGLVIISGGLSESYGLMSTTLFALLLGGTFLLPQSEGIKRLRPLLITALICALVTLLVVVGAPGNQGRQAQLGPRLSLTEGLWGLTLSMLRYSFILVPLRSETIQVLIVVFIGALAMGSASDWQPNLGRRKRTIIALIAAAAFILVASCFAGYSIASAEVFTFGIPPRIFTLSQFILVAAVMLISFLVGTALPTPFGSTRVQRLAGWIILGGLPLLAVITVGILLPDFQAYAAGWDEHARIMTEAARNGQAAVELTNAKTYIVLEGRVNYLQPEPNYWLNACAANYWGVESVVAWPGSPG
jgi:hypothetical protein